MRGNCATSTDGTALVATGALARPQSPLSPDVVRQIAMDIGKEVAHHIEGMYPDAVFATSPNMLVSVRGCVFNEIIAAIATTDETAILDRLEERKRHRRMMKAMRKKRPNPDADLLDLCARLAAMQAEWQRLWNFTSEDWGLDDPPTTEADHEWLRYNNEVWPGINISGETPRHPDDMPGRLVDFHPVTPEGIRAKAAAVLAMDDAGCYGADLRNDSYGLYHSALVDAAGSARCLMGEDAPRW